MTIEAMKQAADKLEIGLAYPGMRLYHDDIRAAITALRTAIAEADKQEPVAWANINKHGDITHTNNKRMPWSKTPLYTTPPAAQRQWVGLTDEEIDEWTPEIHSVIQAIEAKLKEKNT